ncbi:MAG TPA: FKBP-type peptidyl-prolyl cis-trans isomerase [Sphingomicrobium sp.]
MSVAEAAHRPAGTGRAVKLWLGFLIIIAAAVGLAWLGAGSLRPEVSDSGLEFRTIKAGTGEPLGPSDLAAVEYVASTEDGAVLDSSNGPQPFASTMPGLFPGFAEAMGKMREGGQYHFTMPKSLTHGPGQPEPSFKGDRLTFDVRVGKVIRGGAAMMQQMPPGGAPQQ